VRFPLPWRGELESAGEKEWEWKHVKNSRRDGVARLSEAEKGVSRERMMDGKQDVGIVNGNGNANVFLFLYSDIRIACHY
jgi:hypothetical protein